MKAQTQDPNTLQASPAVEMEFFSQIDEMLNKAREHCESISTQHSDAKQKIANLLNKITSFTDSMKADVMKRQVQDVFAADHEQRVDIPGEQAPSPYGLILRELEVDRVLLSLSCSRSSSAGEPSKQTLTIVKQLLDLLMTKIPSWQIKPHWICSTIPFS